MTPEERAAAIIGPYQGGRIITPGQFDDLEDAIATAIRDAEQEQHQRAERAEAACAALLGFYRTIKEYQSKALAGERRWAGNPEMRETWIVRFAYLTQACASAPRIEEEDNPGAALLAVVEAARVWRHHMPSYPALIAAVDALDAPKGASDA